MSEKFCPFRGETCQENCGVWDAREDRCGFVSIAYGANRVKDIEYELYEIRRQLEDNQCCSAL